MKILYVGVIAVLASTTTAASLRTLPEVKEFIFEYDSESEDTPQREVVREISLSVVLLVSHNHNIHTPCLTLISGLNSQARCRFEYWIKQTGITCVVTT